MDEITVKEVSDKQIWENFLNSFPEASFLQSFYWGEFNEAIGNKIERRGFYKNNKLIGVMLSIIEDAKRGKYLTIPAGPSIDWKNSELVEAFVNEAKKIAKGNGCVFIRVRPQLLSDDFSKKLFKTLGFSDAPMHLHAELTNQLELDKSEEVLLSQMRKTTRYEIKKAISQKIYVVTSKDLNLIRGFYELQLETAKRQGFVPFPYNYLYEQFRIFAGVNKALIYSAYFGKKLLAQAVIIFYGHEAVYHYGVSTYEGRNYPGSYLIQWEAIKEAKKRGLKRYNFWGVAPLDKPGHRFYKISIFKRGFGGGDVQYLHARDLIINYPRYLLSFSVESLRKKVRNL